MTIRGYEEPVTRGLYIIEILFTIIYYNSKRADTFRLSIISRKEKDKSTT
jgi:hypothetical protein